MSSSIYTSSSMAGRGEDLLLRTGGQEEVAESEETGPTEGEEFSLYSLCDRWEVEGVREALARGEQVDQRGGDRGWTGLMVAASSGHAAILQLLMNQPGLDVNLTDGSGRTALHLACYKTFEDVGIVRLLLAHPSLTCLNARDSTGVTPLMAAVHSGNVACVRELARLPGVDLETRDEEGLGLEEVARREGHNEAWDEVVWQQLRRRGQERQLQGADDDITIEEITDDEDDDDIIIEEITDNEYEEWEEARMFRGEYLLNDTEEEEEMREVVTKNEPDTITIKTEDKWSRFLEKHSNQKLLLQKKLKSMEAKERLVESGEALKANVDRIQGKMEMEQMLLDSHIDSYKTSQKATQKEEDKFKEQEEIFSRRGKETFLKTRTEIFLLETHKEYTMSMKAKVQEQENKVKKMQDEITSELSKLEAVMTEQSEQERREELECPVCCEELAAPRRIFQCSQGHPVCSSCRPRLRHCPTCRGPVMGRAIGMEQLVQAVRDREGV